MLDDELDRALGTVEFEDAGFLAVTTFERDGDRAVLRFDLHTGVDGERPERWGVTCHGVEAFALSGGPASGVDVSDDDPALWPLAHPSAQLFCGPVEPGRADALLGALYRAHAEAVGEAADAVPFGRGLNAVAAFDGGAGLVAEGPLPLLRVYRAALAAHGVETSIIGEVPPRRWDGQAFVPVPAELRVLLLGDCWVVAAAFEVARAREVGQQDPSPTI